MEEEEWHLPAETKADLRMSWMLAVDPLSPVVYKVDPPLTRLCDMSDPIRICEM